MVRWPLARTWVLAAVLAAAGPLRAADPAGEIRLYALDCGRASSKDSGFLSDTGEYDGKPVAVAVAAGRDRAPSHYCAGLRGVFPFNQTMGTSQNQNAYASRMTITKPTGWATLAPM